MEISKLQQNSDITSERDFRVRISSEKSTNIYLYLSIFKLENMLQIRRLWQQEATRRKTEPILKQGRVN